MVSLSHLGPDHVAQGLGQGWASNQKAEAHVASHHPLWMQGLCYFTQPYFMLLPLLE